MPGQRPILVANDASRADEILTSLKQHLHQLVSHCTFETCREHISWQKKGIVLLLATQPDDLEPLTRLVQEASLRKTSLSMVLIESDVMAQSEALARLIPHVSAKFSWPADAAA